MNYTRGQLFLPLLESIRDAGGAVRPREIYDRVAEKVDLSGADRSATVTYNGKAYNRFERDICWLRQTARARGFIGGERGVWELTAHGDKRLKNIRHGSIVTLFTTANGICYWACAEDAVAAVEPESVDLIFTSPPYPLIRTKEYGTWSVEDWLTWMNKLARDWRSMLAPTGSLMVNLGPVYDRGSPTQNPYIERMTLDFIDKLQLHLCDRLFWHNPCEPPAPRQWVGVKRARLKPSVEAVLWFGRSAAPKANNRNVLQAYAPGTVRWMKRPRVPAQHPSGHDINAGSYRNDNGGAIPSTLITAANVGADRAYRQHCREHGLPAHPATMPAKLPELAIRLCTDPGDLTFDPFFGSGTTALVAERLNRRWIGTERSLAYIAGAKSRFQKVPGFEDHQQHLLQ